MGMHAATHRNALRQIPGPPDDKHDDKRDDGHDNEHDYKKTDMKTDRRAGVRTDAAQRANNRKE